MLTILRGALNHQVGQDPTIDDRAWRAVKPFKKADGVRTSYLEVEEQRRLLEACPAGLRELVAGALYTGARYGELRMLRVHHLYGTNTPFGYEHALHRVFGDQRVGVPDFLNEAERSRLNREADQLKNLEDGPTWLCKRVLTWAKAHPEDPRIPEALHYAVRTTRIGGATELSKACFQILHKKYGKTSWADKTPFYF